MNRGIFLSVIISLVHLSSWTQIELTDSNLNQSCADKCYILEDPEHKISISEVLEMEISSFRKLENKIEILDFNSSRWWLIMEVTNHSSIDQILLDIGRPITNKVDLYEIRDDTVYKKWQNGDGHPYSMKDFRHRKSMFDIQIPIDNTILLIAELESDGEVISMPVRFWNKRDFIANDYNVQFAYGFYYGLLTLVAFIFFFFYLVLRDKSFLFYVIYVFFQILLQFSLDGYSFQYFFPDGGYLTNHIVLISAGGTVVFVILYARSFLRSSGLIPAMDKVLRYCAIAVGTITAISLIPGKLYEISYPIINAFSLVGIMMILVTIFRMKAKGFKVDNYFTTAFVILIIGAVIFILGNFHLMGNAEISQAALKVSSGLEVMALSVSMANEYRRLQKEKEVAQEEALESLRERNELIDKMNVHLEQQVAARTKEIEQQKEELAEKNKDILGSIKYAQRIQDAMMPTNQAIRKILPESFVFFKPRDIVSGDFYFINEAQTSDNSDHNFKIFSAIDCTGHGVPGAFLSIVGNNYLKQGLTEPKVNTPAEALDYLNHGLYKTLRQENDYNIKDGMDLAMCALDNKNLKLFYAGAKNPMYLVRKNTGELENKYPENRFSYNEDNSLVLMEVKADRHAIGSVMEGELKPYTNVEIDVQKEDLIVVFSDGYPDQFGGKKGKKFSYRRFKDLIMSLYGLNEQSQLDILNEQFESWRGTHEQIDDVLIVGVLVR